MTTETPESKVVCGSSAPWLDDNGKEILCKLNLNHEDAYHRGGHWQEIRHDVEGRPEEKDEGEYTWLESDHQITLQRNKDPKVNEPMWAQCTCTWIYNEGTDLLQIGKEAKKHSIESGHTLRGVENLVKEQ